jgi:DNA polymerase-4
MDGGPEPPAGPRRVIAHCDLDAFYASVELLKAPELRGRPLVVCGSGPRAVVTTASYEARQFGVGSAMPAARARARCPHAVFLTPDFTAYRAKSREVWDIVRARAAGFQQVGIDEAYLDVTPCERPLAILRELVGAIHEHTGMVMSVGVGPSKLVAKTVSSNFKPRAFAALSREQACERFASHSPRVLQGVGPKTAERLASMGIETVGALQQASSELLAQRFGDNGARELRARAWFIDTSPVVAPGPAKSRSNETTFPSDVSDRDELEAVLAQLTEDLCDGLRARDVRGRNIAIKVRLDDWTTVTRARTIAERTNDPGVVLPVVLDLFRAYAPARPVRLLGVRLAAFADEGAAREADLDVDQLSLPM